MIYYSNLQPHSNNNRTAPGTQRYCARLHSWLWASRHSARLTQNELADLAGISRKTIHAIETGKQWPTLLVALKLAAALQTDVTKLFTLREHECCAQHNEWDKTPSSVVL